MRGTVIGRKVPTIIVFGYAERVSEDRIGAGMQRQLAARTAALDAGAAHRGWKVAFATASSRAAAGVERSVVGFLTDVTELPDGAEIAIADWARPTIEAELAVRVGEDLSAVAVAVAIEVVDLNLPVDQTEDVLAGAIFHRHYVVGAWRAGDDASDVHVRAFVDDELVASQGDPTSVIGAPRQIVTTVADELRRHGEQLRAGDLVLGGSTIPLQPIGRGQRLRVEAGALGALGLSFR
jgi:2-oxo-3-hexenedioate decarboxylase